MSNKAFTLIEIVVAMFLLTVGTVGAFSLIQKTIAFTSIYSSQLQATYLVQEGMEIIGILGTPIIWKAVLGTTGSA